MVLLESLKIKLGTPAPDFLLQGIDDTAHSLKTYKNAKILVIVFMCNHCPYVQAVWPRLNALQEKYRTQGVQFIGINPNFHPDYPEETLEKMKEYALKYGMNFPYLLDDTQQVAKMYRAQCTPDIYVYDQDRLLAYHGRIDDNWKQPEKVTRLELDEAINHLLKDEKPDQKQFPSMGCSIKWRS